MKKYKVCIISTEAYPYFKGEGSGGSELQMYLLANELVRRGHEVHFIVFGKTNDHFEEINGVNLHIPYYNKKIGWTHLFPKNFFKYMFLLKKINADIYIQRVGPFTTQLIKFLNKIFVFSVSDNDSVSSNLKIKSICDIKNLLHILNLRMSNCVVCQTEYQKELLNKNLSKKGKVIKNIYTPSKSVANEKKKQIIWVGRIIRIKSPETYLKLANSLPQYNFKMIGGTSYGDEQYFEEIKKKAKKIENLEFISNVPHDEIYKYYSEASIFINTSSSEGFPNTFLESWANYTPIVSLNFDPDNIISKHHLGFSSKNFDQLKEYTQKLMENDYLIKKMGISGFNYVRQEHDIHKIGREYEKLFRALLK